MTELTITCSACGHSLSIQSPFSLYEQQAIESSPCPACSKLTLCCKEPEEPRRLVLARRRRERQASRLGVLPPDQQRAG